MVKKSPTRETLNFSAREDNSNTTYRVTGGSSEGAPVVVIGSSQSRAHEKVQPLYKSEGSGE